MSIINIVEDTMPLFDISVVSSLECFKSVLPLDTFKFNCARSVLSNICRVSGSKVTYEMASIKGARSRVCTLKIGDVSFKTKQYIGEVRKQTLQEYAAIEMLGLILKDIAPKLEEKLVLKNEQDKKNDELEQCFDAIKAKVQKASPVVFDDDAPLALAPCVKGDLIEATGLSREEVSYFLKKWVKTAPYLSVLASAESRFDMKANALCEVKSYDRGLALSWQRKNRSKKKRRVGQLDKSYSVLKQQFPLLFTKPYIPLDSVVIEQIVGKVGENYRDHITVHVNHVRNNPVYLDTLIYGDSYFRDIDGNKTTQISEEDKYKARRKLKSALIYGKGKYPKRLGIEVFNDLCERAGVDLEAA